MKITFKLYRQPDGLPARASRAPATRCRWNCRWARPIAQVIEPFALPPKLVHLVLVNGVYVAPEDRCTRVLNEGDVLAIWPPIAGG